MANIYNTNYFYYDPIESGKRIRDLRKDSKLTQARLAEELNIVESTIGKIERGQRSCSIDLLILISARFDTTIDYLVLGKPDANHFSSEQIELINKVVKALK